MKQGEHGAFATFPELGLQVPLHQPPTQENRVDWRHGRRFFGLELAVGTWVACDRVGQGVT